MTSYLVHDSSTRKRVREKQVVTRAVIDSRNKKTVISSASIAPPSQTPIRPPNMTRVTGSVFTQSHANFLARWASKARRTARRCLREEAVAVGPLMRWACLRLRIRRQTPPRPPPRRRRSFALLLRAEDPRRWSLRHRRRRIVAETAMPQRRAPLHQTLQSLFRGACAVQRGKRKMKTRT
jgi:hypothetical protein